MQELWDKYKRCNIHVMRIPKDEARKEVISEAIMTQNVSLSMSDTKPQIQEAQITPSRVNAKRTIARHIMFKQQKIKDEA